jgi:hypothetical protein
MLLSNTVKANVKTLLEENVKCRNCDKELAWAYLINFIADGELSLYQAFVSKDFHFESIRRYRQLLQAEHEHLRGSKYNKRHKHEKEVKEAVK